MNNNLIHIHDPKERANIMLANVTSEKKLQHKIINSAIDFTQLQDVYLNSYVEWLKHPKCDILMQLSGDSYDKY